MRQIARQSTFERMTGKRIQYETQQIVYQIRIRGILDPHWSEWFGGMTVSPQESGDTLLIGAVRDQAALHGLLVRIRDLGMPLLSVERVDASFRGKER